MTRPAGSSHFPPLIRNALVHRLRWVAFPCSREDNLFHLPSGADQSRKTRPQGGRDRNYGFKSSAAAYLHWAIIPGSSGLSPFPLAPGG